MGHRAVNDFTPELKHRLDAIREQNLFRELRRVDSAQGPRIKIGVKILLNFSSNDYLGLANHPALKEAAINAVEKFGAVSGASRLICGSLAPFHELEEALALLDVEADATKGLHGFGRSKERDPRTTVVPDEGPAAAFGELNAQK